MDLVANIFDRSFMSDNKGFGEIGRDAFPVFCTLGLAYMAKGKMDSEGLARNDYEGESSMGGSSGWR